MLPQILHVKRITTPFIYHLNFDLCCVLRQAWEVTSASSIGCLLSGKRGELSRRLLSSGRMRLCFPIQPETPVTRTILNAPDH